MDRKGDAFRKLKIVHLILLTSLALLAVISIVITKIGLINMTGESFNRNLQVITITISLFALLIGFNVFRRAIMIARSLKKPVIKKMEKYRNACIIWWAMIETPGMTAIAGFTLTANHAFLFMGIFHILLLLLFMPRKENIILLLNLKTDEVVQLEGKKGSL